MALSATLQFINVFMHLLYVDLY